MLDKPLRFIQVFPSEHPCFSGHFPDNPVVPGVLLLAVVEAALHARGMRVKKVLQAKFLRPLLPDCACEVMLEPQADTARARIDMYHQGQAVMTGIIEVAAYE